MALTKISTGGVKDDAASQAKIADEAIDEARLQISNAGTNGQFLSKQTGNTGGLTWSDGASEGTEVKSTGESGTTKFLRVDGDGTSSWQVPPDTVYTHPNHSGEVTSTGDGATVIASNIVDEDNLKVSNTPTNGQLLSAQSGNTGGLTWTDPPASSPQIEATADGAITAGDRLIVNTDGTVKKVQIAANELTTYTDGTGTSTYTGTYTGSWVYDSSSNTIVSIFVRMYYLQASNWEFGTGGDNDINYNHMATVDTSAEPEYHALAFSPDLGKSLAIWGNRSGSGDLQAAWITSTGPSGSVSASGSTTFVQEKHHAPALCYDTAANKFILVTTLQTTSSNASTGDPRVRVINISGSSPSVDATTSVSGATSGGGFVNKLVYDNTNNRVYLLRGKGAGTNTGGLKLHIGSLSGTTMTWHNTVVVNSGQRDSDYLDMCWMPDDNKLAIFYATQANIKAVVGTPTGSGGTSSMSIGSVFSVDVGNPMRCLYDPLLKKVIVYYIKSTDSHGYAKVLEVSGTSFALHKDLGTFYNADLGLQAALAYTETGKERNIVVYRQQGTTSHTLESMKTATTATNLTTENYIGCAQTSVSDSATAIVDISGGTNSSQSGLTAGQKYYVQNDGSLGLTAATPAVFGGTAVSSTKLLVNDQQPVPIAPLSEVDEWGQFSGDGNTSYGPWGASDGQWGNNNQTSKLQGELTRSSVSNMPKGTGMTHTNGVFTFPSTGLWEITCNFLIQRYDTNGNTNVMLQHSTNSGSSYITGVDSTYLASGYMFIASNAYHPRGTLSLNAILNVTDKSTFRVRVLIDFGGSNLYVRPNSRIIFKKIG